ncbi:energy transducer TonB, partial [Stenotrophomonas maltophilia]
VVSIERSSGSRSLDQAARQQVLRHWRFEPAQRDGVAVPAIGMVPVQFSLPD